MEWNPEAKVYVAGHRGMVGSAIVRKLKALGFKRIITQTHAELDLCSGHRVDAFFEQERPDYVIVAAAKVGGIHANSTYPAEFIYQNLGIALNCVHSAYRHDVSRLLFLGSTCIYPREAPQPIPESSLLTSPLEPTNEAYAIAKIAGLKLCQHYRKQYGCLFHSAMPTNLYGPGDNYHPENSHVFPALIRRFHEAKVANKPEVVIWGTGKPCREFLHVDDLADAVIHLLTLQNPPDWVNVGSGSEVTIKTLAETVKNAVGYRGKIIFDATKPDGSPRKLSDISKIKETGWVAQVGLEAGIARTYQDFIAEHS